MSVAQNTDTVDAGMRAYLIGVFNKMGLGLLLTAALAWIVSSTPALSSLLYSVDSHHRPTYTVLGWIIAFAPIGIILLTNLRQSKSANFAYWAIVTLFGISLSDILVLYTSTSIVSTFLISAIGFGGLSLWGYTTKKNLSGMGNFAVMALFGLIISMVFNMFLQSGIFDYILSAIGVLLFGALTAYDTQKIKSLYDPNSTDEERSVQTSNGALALYLDFINLFLFLMRFLGVKKD